MTETQRMTNVVKISINQVLGLIVKSGNFSVVSNQVVVLVQPNRPRNIAISYEAIRSRLTVGWILEGYHDRPIEPISAVVYERPSSIDRVDVYLDRFFQFQELTDVRVENVFKYRANQPFFVIFVLSIELEGAGERVTDDHLLGKRLNGVIQLERVVVRFCEVV